MRLFTGLIPLAVIAMWVWATANSSYAQELSMGAQPEPGDQITLNFQGVDIQALINTVSEVTDKNFIVDPRVQGRVTVISGGPLAANQIYDVFLSVLQVHGFSAVTLGDVTKIIPNNLVKQEPTPTIQSEAERVGDDQITRIYKLEHISVQELVPVLRPLLPPTSHFAPFAPANTLVFTDTSANVQRIQDIVTALDVPDRQSDIRIVFLENADSGELSSVLSQLATTLSSPAGEGIAGTAVSVQSDEATNSLIISAPDDEYRLLRAVVDQLDVDRKTQKDIHVIYLDYAKASELVPILNEVGQGLVDDAESPGSNQRRVSVQADESANALVIHANRDDFQAMEAVVEQLDVRRQQVFVEAIIAEVSFSKAADLGVEWQASSNNITAGGEATASTNFSNINGGLTLGFINQFIVNAAGAVVPDLEVILRALRSDSHTNILSTPNLLTLDNESAEIVVAQEVPFVTGQFNTDAVDSGTTTPFQTIERRDVGLTLIVTPQINSENTITLEVEQEISNISPTTVEGASDLITDERRITATVLVEDGQIVVLGGLIRDDVLDSVEWVPVLGRIPVIGALFTRKHKEARKINLMVFLRPRVINDPGELTLQSQRKYEYMRELSQNSQPDTKRILHKSKPPVLPEVEDWGNPAVEFEPEVPTERPGMFP